jgi:hypothetical protein
MVAHGENGHALAFADCEHPDCIGLGFDDG